MNGHISSVLLLGVLASGSLACGSTPQPEPTMTPIASYLPVPVGAWWAAGEPLLTMCGQPVTIWVAGQKQKLGGCASNLPDIPSPVTLHVGEQMGIHFTSDGSQWPFAPPSPSPDGIAELVSVSDNGTTFIYQATLPGTVSLSARGLLCPPAALTGFSPSMPPCDFLALTVVP